MPPRVSELSMEARRALVLARHRAQTERWRAMRVRPGPLSRLYARVKVLLSFKDHRA